MKELFIIKELQSKFIEKFGSCTLSYESINMKKGVIHSFFINVDTVETLDVYWSAISNFIALNFQNSLKDGFEIWNMYVFFLIDFNIENNLKYKIANDTFSSRKLVIESETDIDRIINDHILNKSLDISIQNKITEDDKSFEPSELIGDILYSKPAKSKVDESIRKVHRLIVTKVKGE